MNKQFLLITALAATTVVHGSEGLGRTFEAFATFANAFTSSQTTDREITSGMPSMSKEDRKKHRDNLQPQQLPCPRSERLSGAFTALATFANALTTNNRLEKFKDHDQKSPEQRKQEAKDRVNNSFNELERKKQEQEKRNKEEQYWAKKRAEVDRALEYERKKQAQRFGNK